MSTINGNFGLENTVTGSTTFTVDDVLTTNATVEDVLTVNGEIKLNGEPLVFPDEYYTQSAVADISSLTANIVSVTENLDVVGKISSSSIETGDISANTIKANTININGESNVNSAVFNTSTSIIGDLNIDGNIYASGSITSNTTAITVDAVQYTPNCELTHGAILASVAIPSVEVGVTYSISFKNIAINIFKNIDEDKYKGSQGLVSINGADYLLGLVELPWNGIVDSRFQTGASIYRELTFTRGQIGTNYRFDALTLPSSASYVTAINAVTQLTPGASYGVIIAFANPSAITSLVNISRNVDDGYYNTITKKNEPLQCDFTINIAMSPTISPLSFNFKPGFDGQYIKYLQRYYVNQNLLMKFVCFNTKTQTTIDVTGEFTTNPYSLIESINTVNGSVVYTIRKSEYINYRRYLSTGAVKYYSYPYTNLTLYVSSIPSANAKGNTNGDVTCEVYRTRNTTVGQVIDVSDSIVVDTGSLIIQKPVIAVTSISTPSGNATMNVAAVSSLSDNLVVIPATETSPAVVEAQSAIAVGNDTTNKLTTKSYFVESTVCKTNIIETPDTVGLAGPNLDIRAPRVTIQSSGGDGEDSSIYFRANIALQNFADLALRPGYKLDGSSSIDTCSYGRPSNYIKNHEFDDSVIATNVLTDNIKTRDGTSSLSLTGNVIDAISGANNPSSTNVFATMADVGGGGGGTSPGGTVTGAIQLRSSVGTFTADDTFKYDTTTHMLDVNTINSTTVNANEVSATTSIAAPTVNADTIENGSYTASFSVTDVATTLTADRRDALTNSVNPSSTNYYATQNDLPTPGGTVTGAVQYRGAGGTFSADDDYYYTPATKRLRVSHLDATDVSNPTTNSNLTLSTTGTGAIELSTGGVTHFTLDSVGKATIPEDLEVQGAIVAPSVTADVILANGDLTITPVGSINAMSNVNMNSHEIHNAALIHSQNNNNLTLEGKGTGDLVFTTNNVERMRINDAGATTLPGDISCNKITSTVITQNVLNAISGATAPSSSNVFATMSNIPAATNPGGTVTGAMQYRSATGTFAATDTLKYDPGTNTLSTTGNVTCDKLTSTVITQNVLNAISGANAPSATNVLATMADVGGGGGGTPGGTVTGAIQYRSATGTFTADNSFVYDPNFYSLSLTGALMPGTLLTTGTAEIGTFLGVNTAPNASYAIDAGGGIRVGGPITLNYPVGQLTQTNQIGYQVFSQKVSPTNPNATWVARHDITLTAGVWYLDGSAQWSFTTAANTRGIAFSLNIADNDWDVSRATAIHQASGAGSWTINVNTIYSFTSTTTVYLKVLNSGGSGSAPAYSIRATRIA